MYLKKDKKPNGDVYLSLAESYRDPLSKISKTRVVQKIGYLSQYVDQFEDPIAHFTQLAKQRTQELKAKKAEGVLTINFDADLPDDFDANKNLGYSILSSLYHELDIHTYMLNHSRHRNFKFNPNTILKNLVYSRVLYPGSKKHNFENRDRFFEHTDYSLDDVYRSLDYFCEQKEKFLTHLHKKISEQYTRDTSTVYYDVTNYYFEITEPTELLAKGVSKEHRPNPIVQMGLLMDSQGLPIDYKLYRGNTHDCETYRPFIKDAKNTFKLGRIITVADKAMNTGDNIAYTLLQKNGYIFSQSVRGGSNELIQYVLDPSGYREAGDGFRIKSRLEPRTIYVSKRNRKGEKTGKKGKMAIDEKQIVFWSKKYAEKARYEREKTLEKTRKILANPSQYHRLKEFGANHFIKELTVDAKTGEVLSPKELLYIDEEKIKKAEALDGYYVISTSEYEMSDEEILDKYRELWRIEECFRVTKSELEARPVYVQKEAHIEAHFLTCFIALVLVRLLQKRMNSSIPLPTMMEELRKFNCGLIAENVHMITYNTPIIQNMLSEFKIPFTKKYYRQQDLKKILAQTKKPV